MTPLAGDPSLYLKNKEGRTIPLLGSCVDDTLLGGNEDFQNISEQTLVKFDSKPRQWGSTEFLGVCVETLPGECSSYKLSQPLHIRALKEMPTDMRLPGSFILDLRFAVRSTVLLKELQSYSHISM